MDDKEMMSMRTLANLRQRRDKVYSASVGADFRGLLKAAEAASEPVKQATLESLAVIAGSLDRAFGIDVNTHDDWHRLDLATASDVAAHCEVYYLLLCREFGPDWVLEPDV